MPADTTSSLNHQKQQKTEKKQLTLGEHQRELESRGAELEEKMSKTLQSNEDAENLITTYHTEITPEHMEPLVLELFNQYKGSLKLRWVDFLYTAQSLDSDKSPDSAINVHKRLFTSGQEIDVEERYQALWDWYELPEERLYMMAQLFDKVKGGALLSNNPKKDISNSFDNFEIFELGEIFKSLDQEVLTSGIQFMETDATKWNQLADFCEKLLLERRHEDTGANALWQKLGGDKRLYRRLARYVVSTYFYESDMFSDPDSSEHFYYLFIPYLPSVSKIISGIGFGFRSAELPQTRPLLARASYLNNLWVQYLVRAETSRESSRALEKANHALVQNARAAIMSRNFSHNVGSHSLANPVLYKSVGFDFKSNLTEKQQRSAEHRLSTFHSYMQGRLDFLARAISESSHRPEPLFFLNDVLEAGWFNQGVLLDTLFEDLNFPAEKLEFHICLPTSAENNEREHVEAKYKWCGEKHRFSRKDDCEIEDVLVGLPGGTIGAHALYAFLENVLRNATKYHGDNAAAGHNDIEKLHVYISLERYKLDSSGPGEAESAWLFSIWENLSRDDEQKIAKEIQQLIGEPLIDLETSSTTSRGHGIQEMKLCADLLAGGNNGMRFTNGDGAGKKEPQSLRCYSAPQPTMCSQTDAKWLTYNLFLPIPILLGVVAPEYAKGIKNELLPEHIRYYESIEKLAEQGAHIGVLLEDNEWCAEVNLDELSRLHTALPFRLMVVSDRDTSENDFREELKVREHNYDGAIDNSQAIPKRRIRICDGELGKSLKKLLAEPGNVSELKYLNAGGEKQQRWDAIVLRTYDAWLRIYKPFPVEAKDQWKLCIGFDHGGKTIVERWKGQVKAFSSGDAPCTSVFIVGRDSKDDPVKCCYSGNWISGEDRSDEFKSGIKEELSPKAVEEKSYLLFDNHGLAFGTKPRDQRSFEKGTRFYQKIGLKEGLSLFQSLSYPPTSALGFGLFVYSLVEGALTRIVIIDERVAQATLDDDQLLFGKQLNNYQFAELFPLFNFRSRNGDKELRHPISDRLEQASKDTARNWSSQFTKKGKFPKLWEADSSEGFHFWNPFEIHSVVSAGGQSDTYKVTNIDILILHEGVTDRLQKLHAWQSKLSSQLYCAVPFVVRTSGRGKKTRHLSDSYPYLEFSELSDNTYRGINKPGLVRSLMGVAGDWREAESKD